MTGTTTRRPITPFFAVLVCLVAATIGFGCASEKDERFEALLSIAPDLPAEMARHLVASDDSTLFQYARSAGLSVFSGQMSYLLAKIDRNSPEAYSASTDVIFPVMRRLADVMAIVFWAEKPSHPRLLDLPSGRGLTALRLMDRRALVAEDSTLSYAEKLAQFDAMADTLSAFGMVDEVAITLALATEIAGRSGDVETFFDLSRRALAASRASRHHILTCQVLGMLGDQHRRNGDIDSIYACWDSALALARQKHLYGQEARIETFYAGFNRNLGRLALAQDHYNKVIDIVREGDTGKIGLRYLIYSLDFHANLGAWEIVGRNLPLAKRIENAPGYVASQFESLHKTALRVVEARYLMANGHVTEADSVFANCRESLRGTLYKEHYIRVLRYWATGLLQNGRSLDAVPIVEEGLDLTVDANFTESHCRFLVMRARAALDVGNLSAAESFLAQLEGLDDFEREDLRVERISSAVLRSRVEKRRNNRSGVLSELETATDRFLTAVKSVDASVHGYLWIGRLEELRRELHVAFQDRPRLGYGIELFWRAAFCLLGAADRNAVDSEILQRAFDARDESTRGAAVSRMLVAHAVSASGAVARHGAVHCVYLTIDGEVWRWTCERGTVRRDVLESPADELERVAGRTWFGLSRDPGTKDAAPDARLVDDLRLLATGLLPPEVLGVTPSEDPSLFLVTADGFISRLPFETFNVGEPGRYVPLVRSFDVAYLRHMRKPMVHSEPASGLVIANSSPGRPLRNVCAAPLADVFEETRRVLDRHPGTEVLVNEAATKLNVLASWQKASFLYLATHLLEDPDVRYMALVPLAPSDSTASQSTSYLDMADIRSADFNRCNAVVLNQCSSGKPYVGARNTSPGLSSAFLDAGAGAVVHTFWNVRDEDAGSFTPSILGDLETSPPQLIRALSEAKRARMSPGRGVVHPFFWAPYAIQVGRLQHYPSATSNTTR